VGHLDDDAELVVVLVTGDAGAVRGGADLDQKDRGRRQRQKAHHQIPHHHRHLTGRIRHPVTDTALGSRAEAC
jgi:hypothetical protein